MVGLVIAGGLVVWSIAYCKRTRPRRMALAQLQQVKQQYSAYADDQLAITQISNLLRRHALAVFSRSQVAGLSGQAWLQFLDTAGQTNQFSEGPGQSLRSGPYQAKGMASAAELLPLVERWIQQVQLPSRKFMA